MQRHMILFLVVTAWLFGMTGVAEAYIGPGAGVTVLGTIIAFFGAIFFAIVGFIWYPIKRLLAAAQRRKVARLEVKETSS